jgi:TctA family transporter
MRDGDFSVFLTHPITLILMILSVLTMVIPIVMEIRKNRMTTAAMR